MEALFLYRLITLIKIRNVFLFIIKIKNYSCNFYNILFHGNRINQYQMLSNVIHNYLHPYRSYSTQMNAWTLIFWLCKQPLFRLNS